MPNHYRDQTMSLEALKDMDNLSTFKIHTGSLNPKCLCIMGYRQYPKLHQYAKPQSGTSSSLKTSNQYIRNIDNICTLKTNFDSQICKHACIKWL